MYPKPVNTALGGIWGGQNAPDSGMSARAMTDTTPFEHKVNPRRTEFRMAQELADVTIQDVYAALVNDALRNELIFNDIVHAVESGRCPLLLAGRTEHLQYFSAKLRGIARHVFVLKGGMGKKQRRDTAAALASVPEDESRVILATGSYIGEGFDDARLDTLLARMYGRRLKGYDAIGYVIERDIPAPHPAAAAHS